MRCSSRISRLLGGLGAGVAAGATAMALFGLASAFSYTHLRLGVMRWMDEQVQRDCDELGASRSSVGEDWICVAVPASGLEPGRVVTRADLNGVWMPVYNVANGVVRDPSGRTVARRLLPDEFVREARLQPVTP